MGYTYDSFQLALATFMALPNAALWVPPATAPWPNFAVSLPSIIDYAEQRCYRELDLLDATSAQTVPTVALQSTVSLASLAPLLLILEDVNVILPAGTAVPDDGERVWLVPASKEYVRAVFGSAAGAAAPSRFAMLDDKTIILGPFPDQIYTLEIIGKFRPTPLYSAAPDDGTQTTFLANILPDLFFAAAMISASGYQKNFSAVSDDPQSAMSWERQFQLLLQSAKSEEMRKRFHGWQALTSEQSPPPTPAPTPGG